MLFKQTGPLLNHLLWFSDRLNRVSAKEAAASSLRFKHFWRTWECRSGLPRAARTGWVMPPYAARVMEELPCLKYRSPKANPRCRLGSFRQPASRIPETLADIRRPRGSMSEISALALSHTFKYNEYDFVTSAHSPEDRSIRVRWYRMFKFLKRFAVSKATAAPQPQRRPSRSRVPEDRTEPSPLPEVREGNEQTDWALWEDSVAALDSQLQGLNSSFQELSSSVRIYDQPEPPSEYQDIDAFAKVTKRDA